jgi:hypothetical protein
MRRFRTDQQPPVIRSTLLAIAIGAALLVPDTAARQARHYPLDSKDGLRLNGVTAEPIVFQGKKGLRVRMSDAQQPGQAGVGPYAVIEGLEFANGVIDAEIAGAPAPGAPEGARGFVGIAFRLQKDMKTYDAFYLRPTNGRAEDQERRNHATQYISHPQWTWSRLRSETPSKYESYVDLVPGDWTRIRIEVRGEKARLFVHDQQYPALIVNDVKSGANTKGGVALWVGPGTVAHFRNLTVKAEP